MENLNLFGTKKEILEQTNKQNDDNQNGKQKQNKKNIMQMGKTKTEKEYFHNVSKILLHISLLFVNMLTTTMK